MHFLLDPARFQEMDTIFVKVARDMLAAIPALPETQANQQRIVISYDGLKKFQEHRQQLNNLCEQIFQIIQDCQEGGFLPHSFIEEAKEVWEKNQSQRFRLAVVGEFSQGKSTLLNALLGETIQPAREIPCSGTITVLKYGKQKRVVCLYKNGRKEEIPFEEYQQKASISEDAAIDCLSDELAQSEIEELIFEHPDLELCSNGVEIVDSPGLNEHPERTAITQKLLANTDAVIFLTNASRPLTEGERSLLHDLKVHLNGGKETEPADNLFVTCNFMDLIRTEKGKEQIKQRVTKFVQGDNPIVSGTNRVHFISAQAALDEILAGKEDEHLQNFRKFTSSIENFLVFERGTLNNQRSTNDINKLIQKNLDYLNQARNIVEGKIEISENEKQKIIEQIGEASGRDIKIRLIAERIKKEVFAQALKSWKKWYEGLNGRMITKSQFWSSEHSPVWSRDKLIRDYTNQFMRNLSEEIDNWGDEILKNVILREYVKLLDTRIAYQLDAVQADYKNLDIAVKTNFSNQLKPSIDGISDDFMGFRGIGGGIGIGGSLAAALVIFTGVGFIAVIVTSVVAAIAGSFGLGMLDIDGIHNQIKTKVLELGFQKFEESRDKVVDKLSEIIEPVFNGKVESASRVISEAISLYENLLEQQEKVHQETLEEREADKVCIFQKYQELEQMQNTIKSIIIN